MKDFFISYTQANRAWAEWIAAELESAGFSTVIQAWDFQPGRNFVSAMHQAAQEAERTLAVLSPAYFSSKFGETEWAAAFAQDPTGENGLLVPVRVEQCDPPGLLGQVVYIDLVERDETAAREALLARLQGERPSGPRPYPGRSPTEAPKFPGQLPPHWNVPYRRNPNFTGRERELEELRETLTSGQLTALTQALSGLGGVGKTQLALEYSYRHSVDYEGVWWLPSETPTALAGHYARLATELKLPESDAPEQALIVAAVQRWLSQHRGWLLVFDNAPEPEQIQSYLPQGSGHHVLVTSRNPNWDGLVNALSVKPLVRSESVELLLKRTGQTDENAADTLAEALGDLPLALDQAGAYMVATGRSLESYLALFQEQRQALLSRGKLGTGYPDTVATTWTVSFQAIEAASSAAAGLLYVCAFLAPDAIPRSLIEAGLESLPESLAQTVADPIALDEVLALLRRYAVLEVTPETLSMHRLIQAVVRSGLGEEASSWAVTAVALVARAFPEGRLDDPATWPECEQFLPHALLVTSHVEAGTADPESVSYLLNQSGLYLTYRAGYAEAEPLYQRGLAVREKALGPEHPAVATSLNNLAALYDHQSRYAEAEPLYQRSLAIVEEALGPEHPAVVTSLNNLAALYRSQGRYAEAEPLYQRSLAIVEEALGPEHPDVATSLNNLAELYRSQGRYAEAEPLYQRSLAIWEKALGPEHPAVATSLNNLALLYNNQGRYAEAEPLYQRSLAVREKALGPEHPAVATSLNNLAALYNNQGRSAEAEPLYQRSLAVREKALGPEHPAVATSLNNLAELYRSQGRSAEAKPLYQRSLAVREKALGPEHPAVATSLNNLAALYNNQGRSAEAKPLYQRSLAIVEEALGPEHPDVATSLNNLAELYHDQGRYAEAEPLCERSLGILEKALGLDHPLTIMVRENYQSLKGSLREQ